MIKVFKDGNKTVTDVAQNGRPSNASEMTMAMLEANCE
jgi:hypothetical protein